MSRLCWMVGLLAPFWYSFAPPVSSCTRCSNPCIFRFAARARQALVAGRWASRWGHGARPLHYWCANRWPGRRSTIAAWPPPHLSALSRVLFHRGCRKSALSCLCRGRPWSRAAGSVCRRAIVGSRNVRKSIGKSLAAARPSSPQCASCPRGDLLSVGPVCSFDSVVRVDSARLLANHN